MIYVKSAKNAGGYDANGNLYIIADLICDYETDLPAPDYFITQGAAIGYNPKQILAQGSRAAIIDTGAEFIMLSNGTWSLISPGVATYTKSEIDDLLAAKIAELKNSLSGE